MQATSQTTPVRDTHVYKVVDGRELEADVIGACAGASKPCVVWIHGGGLIFGWRKTSPRAQFLRALLERDFVVVSIDHRLAPETKLPSIVDDVRDAWLWVHDVGPRRFGIDPARMAMAGASAGAYLSLLAGGQFTPRPRALASFWGYGDITAPWEAEPSAHYRQMDLVTRADAVASLWRTAGAGSRRWRRPVVLLPLLPAAREVAGGSDRARPAHGRRVVRIPIVRSATRRRSLPPTGARAWRGRYGCAAHAVLAGLAARLAARKASSTGSLSLAAVGHGFAGARPEEAEAAEIEVADFLRAQLGVSH